MARNKVSGTATTSVAGPSRATSSSGSGSTKHRQISREEQGAQEGSGKTPRLEEDKLESVLRSVLPGYMDDEVEADDFQETISHLLSQASSASLDLSSSAPATTSLSRISELTLDELDSHPLCTVLFPDLQELLGISQSLESRTRLVEEVLSGYARLRDQEEEEGEVRYRPGKGGMGECQLCERNMLLTAHHLIPRSMHPVMLKRDLFTLSHMRSHLLWICRPCHSFIHSHLPADRLATEFNTLEALLDDEGVVRWAKYASKLKEKDPRFSGVGRFGGNVGRLREQR